MSDSAANPSDPLGLVGTLIDDRYKVEKLIGRGGMGYVYRAEQTRIRRPVAIKVLSQLQARRRFEREALTTARIEHRNSVRLNDFGHLEDGTMFLVMELLEGVSLASVIDDGPLPVPRALRICRDVLSALGHAHKQGVVHRDVKPENIYLCRDEDDRELAKVLDFGIAKLIRDATTSEEGDQLTEAGMAIGTPTYMSPEQGFGSGIDGRSDLYSMTVVLFEMLTGKPPFRADTPLDTLRLHISEPAPTLVSRAAKLAPSAALEAVVADGLAKKTDERIATAHDYIQRIDRLLSDAEVAPFETESADRNVDRNTDSADTRAPSPSLELAAAASKTASVATVAATETTTSETLDWFHRRRLVIAAGAAALALLVILVVAAGSSGTDAESSTALKWLPIEAPPPPRPAATALALEATQLLDAGKPSAAISLVTADRSGATDSTAQLVLGHAYARKQKTSAAIAAYDRALEASVALGGDETLLANLRRYLESRRRETAQSALDALTIAAESKANEEARRILADVASGHPKAKVRKRAQDIADSLDVDDLDWLSVHSLDLRQGRTCQDRLEAVKKLRKLGDKAAIPVLRKAERRRSGGFLGIGSKNVNHCLRDEARAAIAELEGS